MKSTQDFWLAAWYGKTVWVYALLPVSWLFRSIAFVRKYFISRFFQQTIPVPVVVVGNISLGGTGKTPLLIALVEYLQQKGYRPGVVSRGYGGSAPHYPYEIDNSTSAHQSGDEPLLIFKATGCKVCVAPDRVAAAMRLVAAGCNIILSDDGLQHYRLGRDLEIAVVDGLRLFGNRQCLPAGPLREPVSRLGKVDLVVVNNPQQHQPLEEFVSYPMHVIPKAWRDLSGESLIALQDLPTANTIHAIAGIGNPQRFFNTLMSLSLTFEPHAYSDHHQFTRADLQFSPDAQVLMTEKDAVKCAPFAQKNWYSLQVGAQLPDAFWQVFQRKLDLLKDLKK